MATNLWRKPCLFLLCVLCSHVAANANYNPKVVETRFNQWAVQNGKHYKDRDEWMLRFGIYHSNLQFIEMINSQNLKYKLGDNEFADLTNDEFNAMYLGRLVLLRSRESCTTANDEDSLQKAVAQQPVSVGIEAGNYYFQLYKSGIFNGHCGKHLDHGVTIVGYGEEDGVKYWTVKNSWGGKWGEAGYIRMLRSSEDREGICGITMMASYPVNTY